MMTSPKSRKSDSSDAAALIIEHARGMGMLMLFRGDQVFSWAPTGHNRDLRRQITRRITADYDNVRRLLTLAVLE